MIYWLLSIVTALVACFFGNINPMTIASNYVFKKNLRRLGSGGLWFSKFNRLYGWKGFVKLAAVELVIDILPIIIGGLLFGTKDQAAVGRSLAAFCLIISRTYPILGAFTGTDGLVAMMIGLMFMDTTVGISVLIAVAIGIFAMKYRTAANVLGGITAIAMSTTTVDELLVMRLCAYVGILIVIRNIRPLIAMINGNEEKISFREDLTYKFDEKF